VSRTSLSTRRRHAGGATCGASLAAATVTPVVCPHTSEYVSLRQHTSAYVSLRQHTGRPSLQRLRRLLFVRIRQHTSAYVSLRQHTGRPSLQRLRHLFFGIY
jgi:hypothetical protein